MSCLKRLACIVIAITALCAPLVAAAKDTTKSQNAQAADASTLQNAAQKGLPLDATINVADQASVEAVLIPASLARKIFGTEVAHNYAVIELIVSNKDSKAALIVHSVFLDYSQWLPSGVNPQTRIGNTLENTQKANQPWQVASVEARLVRGELLDAQQWTKRNWTIRSLTAVGSIAAGFQFPFSGEVAKGIAAFNGEVIPGASVLWPDGTVNQVNRIADYGFQANKIVAKQSSDIVIAFFPIDRFLTPTLRNLFIADPAVFFMPGQMMAEKKLAPKLTAIMLPFAKKIVNDLTAEELPSRVLGSLIEDCSKDPTTPDCRLQNLFSRLSLNSVRVVIGGAMSVDVTAIPATIYSVTFDEGDSSAALWTTPDGEHTGKLSGVYLTGGTLSVVDSTGKAIGGITVTVDSSQSSDTDLAFTMKVSKCVPSSTGVYFVVSKSTDTNPDGSKAGTVSKKSAPLLSTPFQFAKPSYTCPAPAVEGGAAAGGAKDCCCSSGKRWRVRSAGIGKVRRDYGAETL